MKSYKSKKTVLFKSINTLYWLLPLLLCGIVLLSFSPLLITMVGSWYTENILGETCHEGNCFWGAFFWLMFITVPFGILLILVLIIILVYDLIILKKNKKNENKT